MESTMASVQPRGDRFQLRVVNSLLPRPYFCTFDTEAGAREHGAALERALAKGIVPQELLVQPGVISPPVVNVIDDYKATAPSLTASDDELLVAVSREVVGVRVSGLTYSWVEGYVRHLKTGANLGPSTIRKRVGVLGRVIDWHLLKTTGKKAGNPLRMLPVGYSSYSAEDARRLPAGAAVKRDVQRDRRLTQAEEAAVRLALSGVCRPDRERALKVDPSLSLMLDLILDTGLRLKEAYTLRWDQVDTVRGLLRVDGSKGHRGMVKARTVPLKSVLRAALAAGTGLVFPFWDGTPEGLKKASTKLSVRFGKLFEYAGVEDFTEHDLRHEACCRWIELRNAAGGWTFSDVEVCRIMGWSNFSMILRYASLRGEDLADRLL